jgi:hypothetical protein
MKMIFNHTLANHTKSICRSAIGNLQSEIKRSVDDPGTLTGKSLNLGLRVKATFYNSRG